MNDFCIGNSKGGHNPAYDTLDELRLWNIYRTEEEIRANRYRSISAAPADCAGLVFYCKFEEGSGQSITESVKAVSGTVHGRLSPDVAANGVWAASVPNPVWTTHEDTAVSGYLMGSDADGDALTYSIVAPGSSGVAAITSGNRFTYTPAADFSGADSFTYTVTDTHSAVSAAQTVNVTVTPVNDAPVLTPAAPALAGITASATGNAGQTVSSFADSAISDADAGSLKGIAIVAATDAGGKWQYSTDGGSVWADVGTVGAANALLLKNTDSLRFVPGGPYAATAKITYRAWDQTFGDPGSKADVTTSGGAAAFSAAADTAILAVSVGIAEATPFYVGNALRYDDSDDSLSAACPTAQKDDITMEAWIKADTLSEASTNIRIMYNGDSSKTGYGIYLSGAEKTPCILLGSVAFLMPSPTVSLETGKWNHLAAVRDGGTWPLYVNGTRYTLSPSTATPNNINLGDSSTVFSVGSSSVAGENFIGCIDEVRFWTVPRTPQQIKDHMYIKLNGNETGLLAYYNFDQPGITPGGSNSGIDTVTDVAGGDHNLTVSGFALTGNTSNFVPSVQLGSFALSSDSYEAVDGGSPATITINRTGGSEGPVTISYTTHDGTATAGTEYTSASGSVTFAEGETSKTISVPMRNASIPGQKQFTCSISGPSGVSFPRTKNATITIYPALKEVTPETVPSPLVSGTTLHVAGVTPAGCGLYLRMVPGRGGGRGDPSRHRRQLYRDGR